MSFPYFPYYLLFSFFSFLSFFPLPFLPRNNVVRSISPWRFEKGLMAQNPLFNILSSVIAPFVSLYSLVHVYLCLSVLSLFRSVLSFPLRFARVYLCPTPLFLLCLFLSTSPMYLLFISVFTVSWLKQRTGVREGWFRVLREWRSVQST